MSSKRKLGAIAKISLQQKKKEKSLSTKYEQEITRSRLKEKLFPNRKDVATRRHSLETRKVIDIEHLKRQTIERKQDVVTYAKRIAAKTGTTYRKVLAKESPTIIEKQFKPLREKLHQSLPTKREFLEVYNQGRIGRGLDYFLPFTESAYHEALRAARSTGMAIKYMLSIIFEWDGQTYISVLFHTAEYIGSTYSWNEILDAAGLSKKTEQPLPSQKGAVGRITKSYPKKSASKGKVFKSKPKVLGLKIHFTIRGRDDVAAGKGF